MTASRFAPIAVTRMAALAKASSLGGAAFGGLAAGFFVYSAGFLNLTVPRGDAINAGITAVAAGTLVAAALYLERCCRTPPRDRDDARLNILSVAVRYRRGLERHER